MNAFRSRWWNLLDDEEGVSLVELMLAMFVLSVALLAMASVGTTSLVQLRISRDREQATNAASTVIEQVRARDFRDVVHAGDADLGTLPADIRDRLGVDGEACADGAPLVRDGAVTDPLEFHRLASDQETIDVYTIVLWEHEAGGDCASGPSDLKRVIALARWEDSGRVMWGTQETLVTQAARGLPVPNFRVRPSESTLAMSISEAGEGARRCIPHQLRNLGATDRYEWELTDVDRDGAPFRASETRYQTPNKKWSLRAYLELDPDPEVPPDENSIMKDTNNNGRMVSDLVVPSGATPTFTVCYTAEEKDATPFELELTVFSRFDENKTEILTHHVSVVSDPESWFLLDWADDIRHSRCVPGPDENDACPYEPYVMTDNVSPDSEESFTRIGTADYTLPAESNWSTEIGDEDLPGMRLLQGEVDNVTSTAAWHRQLPVQTTLVPWEAGDDGPFVRLWVAPVSALTEAFAGPVTTRLDVRLDVLESDETTVAWTGVAEAQLITHETPGWQQVEIPFESLTDAQTFDKDQFLRLRVTCHPDSDEDCNLAYDNVDYPSEFRARFVR